MEFLFSPVLDERGKIALMEHKYQSGTKSLGTPYLDIWWEAVVQFVPPWIAPNLLTLCSFLIEVVAFFVYAHHDPTFSGTVDSPALYFYQFASLFLYQTLDGMDGKHARRHRQGSPLGQLFDHGCDSVLLSIVISMIFCIFEGPMLFCVCAVQFNFFIKNWKKRHTGTMDFEAIDIEETSLLAQILFVVFAIYGTEIAHVSIFGVKLWWFLIIAPSVLIAFQLTGTIREVNEFYRAFPVSSKRKRFDDDRFYEIGNLILLHFALFCWNTVDIYSVNPTLFLVTVSMAFAHLAHRLIICDVTQRHSRKIQLIVVPFVVIGALAVMEKYSGRTLVGTLSMKDERVLIGVALYSGCIMWSYAIRCVVDISNALDIYVFRYNEPKELDKEA